MKEKKITLSDVLAYSPMLQNVGFGKSVLESVFELYDRCEPLNDNKEAAKVVFENLIDLLETLESLKLEN